MASKKQKRYTKKQLIDMAVEIIGSQEGVYDFYTLSAALPINLKQFYAKKLEQSEEIKEALRHNMEELALEKIDKHSLYFVEDLTTYLPISRRRFYDLGLHSLHTIKEALLANKLRKKAKLRRKWETSGNGTTEVVLYKLLANEDELARLNGTDQTHTVKLDGAFKELSKWSEIPLADRKKLLETIKSMGGE